MHGTTTTTKPRGKSRQVIRLLYIGCELDPKILAIGIIFVNNNHGYFCVDTYPSNQKMYDSIAELVACVFTAHFIATPHLSLKTNKMNVYCIAMYNKYSIPKTFDCQLMYSCSIICFEEIVRPHPVISGKTIGH